MKTAIIIPARFESTRYPGKPLAKIDLGGGLKKTLIQLTWEAAKAVKRVDSIFVATDDVRISSEVEKFGGNVIMTSKNCKNGTERCAEAVSNMGITADLIVNLQGDAPLTPPVFIEALVNEMIDNSDVEMATPVLRLSKNGYMRFRQDRENGLIGGTTVVFDSNGFAMYFSKELIPFFDMNKMGMIAEVPIFHHAGVYSYRPELLHAYLGWPEGKLETVEGLEQLRFLENGSLVKCVEVLSDVEEFWELNNPQDVQRIESVYKKRTK